MKAHYFQKIVWIGLIAILTSCSGGGGSSTSSTGGSSSSGGSSTGSSTSTGYLIDASVAGATYSTSSGLTGTTAIDGSFQFKDGDTVTFTVLGVQLGSGVAVPGNGVITPLTISGNATATTSNTEATAIAQFLQTVASLSSSSVNGVSLVIPTGSAATTLQTNLGSSASPAAAITALANANITVVPAATAISQVASAASAANAAASSAYLNTVWTVTCEGGCGGATVEFLGNGTITGATLDGDVIFGTWNDSGSGVTISAATTKNGHVAMTINPLPETPASCTACLTLAQDNGTSLLDLTYLGQATPNSNDTGLWYALFTPNATGIANGASVGIGAVIAEPGGNLAGEIGNTSITGTWTGTTFSATGTTQSNGGGGGTILASGSFTSSATVTFNGANFGTLTLSRASPALTTISVSAPITINWANSFNSTCGDCNPSININVSGVGSIDQNFTNPFNNGDGGAPGQGTPTTLTTTESGSVFTLGGTTNSYTVSVDSSVGSQSASVACSVTGGATGTFTTSSAQSTATLSAITVTCSN